MEEGGARGSVMAVFLYVTCLVPVEGGVLERPQMNSSVQVFITSAVQVFTCDVTERQHIIIHGECADTF